MACYTILRIYLKSLIQQRIRKLLVKHKIKKVGLLMKILKYFPVLTILFVFPGMSHPADLGDLRISLIEGDVQVNTEDTGDWVPASINMPLQEGDRIWVPEEARTELQLRDRTCVRLNEESALEVLTVEDDSIQTFLNEGRAYVNLKGQKGTILQMDTPLASVRAYERSIFLVDVSKDGPNKISVLKGSVDVESDDGKTTIERGYALILDSDNYAETSSLGEPDDWEDWNRERDRRSAGWRSPPRYLPEDLYPYSDDFEENGRWVNDSEYGYVWTPTVVVSAGWAPYRLGRWMWIHGDYVWISHEPWGWAPYHYGRWAFRRTIGWCWVPPVRGSVIWGPGFVGWIHTPTYVAWIPLGPRDVYYGRGHYGHHSVNITKVNVTHINVNNISYHNVHVRNAVTMVDNDDFVHGRHRYKHGKDNPFLKEKISIGGPNIRPKKDANFPIVKEGHHKRRPPASIQNVNVNELKEKRHLTRARDASVLRPDSAPKVMKVKTVEGTPVERKWQKVKGSKTRSEEAKKTMEKGSTQTLDMDSEPKGGESTQFPQSAKGKKGSIKSEQSHEVINETGPEGQSADEYQAAEPSEKRLKKTRTIKPQEEPLNKTVSPEQTTQGPAVTAPQEDKKERTWRSKRSKREMQGSGSKGKEMEGPQNTSPVEQTLDGQKISNRTEKSSKRSGRREYDDVKDTQSSEINSDTGSYSRGHEKTTVKQRANESERTNLEGSTKSRTYEKSTGGSRNTRSIETGVDRPKTQEKVERPRSSRKRKDSETPQGVGATPLDAATP
ncbi:hypothetical protein PITCH_A1150087 [uncultured Desulfobacterium sp.]|uniref:FecR protein domain-containing protein n=1 Tax=uncultured Desulfobacterium sp. TaxID=201089 RepID=A0A445MRK7_9BACT|nr:hypothetical protein PITCH_A1150087 [uncultured Desulfobacterium sp.]